MGIKQLMEQVDAALIATSDNPVHDLPRVPGWYPEEDGCTHGGAYIDLPVADGCRQARLCVKCRKTYQAD